MQLAATFTRRTIQCSRQKLPAAKAGLWISLSASEPGGNVEMPSRATEPFKNTPTIWANVPVPTLCACLMMLCSTQELTRTWRLSLIIAFYESQKIEPLNLIQRSWLCLNIASENTILLYAAFSMICFGLVCVRLGKHGAFRGQFPSFKSLPYFSGRFSKY